VLDPGLAREPEHQDAVAASYVAPLESGQSVTAELVGGLLGPWSKTPEVDEPYAGRENATPLDLVVTRGRQELVAQLAPYAGERARQCTDAFELLEVALLAPLRVVQVLAPAGIVGTDGLQVTAWVGADPDVVPRRRNHQVADSLDVASGQGLASLVEVAEPSAVSDPAPAGLLARDSA